MAAGEAVAIIDPGGCGRSVLLQIGMPERNDSRAWRAHQRMSESMKTLMELLGSGHSDLTGG